jgi:calcineurin-like phosphoesterase
MIVNKELLAFKSKNSRSKEIIWVNPDLAKKFKGLSGHRFPFRVDVVHDIKTKGNRTYDHLQAYRKITEVQEF